MGFADEAPGYEERKQAVEARHTAVDKDPTEYLPVMRHHLHETLWALNLTLGYVEAQDLADSYRNGLNVPKKSPLARALDRAHATMAGYLGLLDEEPEEPEASDAEPVA